MPVAGGEGDRGTKMVTQGHVSPNKLSMRALAMLCADQLEKRNK
jgi:hypothetical protein